jgi:hypothetical protein
VQAQAVTAPRELREIVDELGHADVQSICRPRLIYVPNATEAPSARVRSGTLRFVATSGRARFDAIPGQVILWKFCRRIVFDNH